MQHTGITRNSLCPSCSNISPQELLYSYTFEEQRPYDKTFNFAPGEGPQHRYFVAACSTCRSMLVYMSTYDPCEPTEFHRCDIVYPHGVALDHSVPERVRQCYAEAKRIQHNSPNAFTLMLRRALEAICEDQGITSGSLKSKLDKLASDGTIPPVLAAMSWALRILGNESAHEQKEMSVYTTWILDDFFKAIVEFVYVAPSKLAQFERHLQELSSNGTT